MRMLEALIFDVDGTVAETEDLHRRAFNLAFARHGMDFAWNEPDYRRLLRTSGGKERIARAIAERGARLPAEDIAAIHATKTAIYEELLRVEGVAWRPGIQALMAEGRARGLGLALATTTSDANLEPLLRPVLGERWRASFAAIVTGDQVPRKKPAPDVYVETLRRLRVGAADAMALEDSRAGVEAARAAGVPVVAVPSYWLAGDDLSQADLVVEHLGDAEALIAWHARRHEGQERRAHA
jgi:HAD superfamily hydrolase (TIGR01509 family)